MKINKNSFSTLLHTFRQKSYFKQILGSYIVVSCFTFIVFSILLLTFIRNQYSEEMKAVNEQNVTQARAFTETSLYDISYYCYNLLDSNATLYKLLYNDDYDIVTAINARETYDTIRNVSSMVSSCDLINYTANTVLTKSTRTTLDLYSDQELLKYLEELTPSKSPYFWIPRTAYYHGESSPEQVLSLIYYTNKQGALVVNINYESYASQLNLSSDANLFHVLLINQYGQVMASTDSDLFGTDYSQEELYLLVSEQTAREGSFTYTSEGKKQTVNYYKNGTMGITYISVLVPGGMLSSNTIFGLTLRSSILYLIITLLLSFFISWILYQPVRRLGGMVHKNAAEDALPGHTNEFTYLESVYTDLLEKSSSAMKKEQLYAKEKEQQALGILLTGGDISNYYPNTEALEEHFDFLLFRIVLIYADRLERSRNLDMPTVRFMIHNVASELTGDAIVLKNIDTQEKNRIVLLSNFKQPNNTETIRLLVTQMQEFFHGAGIFSLSFGIGSVVSDLDSLSSSYESASVALNCGMYQAEQCISFYEDLMLVPLQYQTYPYAEDTAIITAVKNQNLSEAEAAIDAFFLCISRYNYEQIYRCLLQLLSSIQKFEYANNLSSGTENQDFAFNDSTNVFSQTQELWKSRLLQRCTLDIQELTSIKLHNTSKETLITQVQDIVAKNIYNINLSVVMIAEQVGLSVNYLRSIYKESTGESLSTYISGQKLKLSCKLLTDNELSIQEISDQLGFTTKNYFFTFFKKHTGMTPSQYRREVTSDSKE